MTSMTLVRRINARPTTVFDALVTAEQIARWWGPDAGPVLFAESDPRIGGRFRVRFRIEDGSEHESSGEYLELERPHRVVMSWRWLGGAEDPGESRIEIDLKEIAGGTELTFTHSRLADEASARGHEAGWNGALDKLERELAPITLSAFRWVPDFARGLVRDLRVRWALEEARLPYRERLIDHEEKRGAAYRALQPFGQVPALEIGALKLFESGAIVLHLGERSEALLPREPAARARTQVWMFAALNSVEPPIQHLIELDVFFAAEPWSRERRPSALAAVHRRLDALEGWLGESAYLEGERFTAADLLMSTVLRILRHTDIIGARPRLAAYQARCEARPAFGKALGDQLRGLSDRPG